MKNLWLLSLLLLTSCSIGSKIVQLDCKYNNIVTKQEWLKENIDSEDFFIFNKSTGEYYSYSDFYEKLEVLDGVVVADGIKEKFESIIVNNKFKLLVEYMGSANSNEQTHYYMYEINLKDLTIKTTGDLGVGDKFTSTGTCKYGVPESREVVQDKEKST